MQLDVEARSAVQGFALSRSLSSMLLDSILSTSSRRYDERVLEGKRTNALAFFNAGWFTTSNPSSSSATAAYTEATVGDIGCCLCQILGNLSPKDLARAQMVCRQWYEVGCLTDVRCKSFMSKWSLAEVHAPGNARRVWTFLQSISSAETFVRKHLVQAGEIIQTVAVMHGADMNEIKRVNCIISDNSINCRTCLYIPVFKSAQELVGQVVEYEYCRHSKRSFAVVTSTATTVHQPNSQQPHLEHSEAKELQLLKKMSTLLSKSLRIDESSALYYMEEAGGDLKKAMRLAEVDAAWERCAGPRRSSHNRLS